MRKSSYLPVLCLAGLLTFLVVGSANARSPVSIRLISGLTEAAGGYAYESDHLAPVFGLGVRFRLSDWHSIFVDVERVQRWAGPFYRNESFRTDFVLSREPLTELSDADLTLYPITLGYQFDFLKSDKGQFSPFITAGANLVRVVSSQPSSPRYPSLDISAIEGIERSETAGRWKFGALGAVGCAARINSWLSLSGIMSYRHVGLPSSGTHTTTGRVDIQQNLNGIVFEGTAFGQDLSTTRNGAFEGRFLLEFRL